MAIALLAVGLVPVAAGDGWLGGSGPYEPNTDYDTGDHMWQSRDEATSGEERIYFNGFITTLNLIGIGTQPQMDGGTNHFGQAYVGNAVLGYWRDCNADGYIGNKNTPTNYGNWGSYPADVYADEVDPDVCPEGMYYNDGAWINEFLRIAPEGDVGKAYEDDAECEPQGDAEATVNECVTAVEDQYRWRFSPNVVPVPEEKIKVWMDLSAPDATAATVRSSTERGWMQDSDGTLRRVDFGTGGFLETLSEEGLSVTVGGETHEVIPATGFWEDKPNVGGCDRDVNGDRIFGSGDTNTCGVWPLYQVKRLVNDSDHEDDRATPLVRTWGEESDCGEPVKLFDDIEVETPAGDVNVRGTYYHKDVEPGIRANPLTEGSIGGTIVHFREGFDNYNETSGECENEYGFTNLEGGESRPAGKRRVNSALFYLPEFRTRAGEDVSRDDAPMYNFGPRERGIWTSEYIWRNTVPAMGTATIFQYWNSFYAYVGEEAVTNNPNTATVAGAIPSGRINTGVYGEDQCTDGYNTGKPSHGNWLCDQEAWEQQLVDDGRSRDRYPIIGEPYTFRDVDCYDGTLFRQEIAGQEVAPRASALAVADVANGLSDEVDLPSNRCPV